MDKINKLIQKILLIIYVLINILIIVLTIYNNIFFSILSILFIIVVWLILKKTNFKIIKILDNKRIFVIFLLIGIIIRFSLLLFNYPPAEHDEMVFYDNAVKISENIPIFNQYVATFPYLYPYIFLLGNIFKILGSSFKVVVFMNIIIDLIGAFTIYKFFKNIKNKNCANISLFIWLYNPFQIVWNTVCLPLIAVNTLIILSMYVFSILYKKFSDIKYNILFSICLGLTLSISNSFRPIMIIFLIAIFIYYCYLAIIKEQRYKNLIVSFLLIFLLFQGGNLLIRNHISSVTGYEVSNSSGGWSLYLGSCYETNGQWHKVDKFGELLYKDDYVPAELHYYFQNEALKNYKQNGLRNILLFIKKSNVLVSRFDEFTINNLYAKFDLVIPVELLKIFTKAIWFIIIICNIFILKLKDKDVKLYFPYLLFFIGLFLASLLVEILERYFVPNLVVLMIGSTISIDYLITIIKGKTLREDSICEKSNN